MAGVRPTANSFYAGWKLQCGMFLMMPYGPLVCTGAHPLQVFQMWGKAGTKAAEHTCAGLSSIALQQMAVKEHIDLGGAGEFWSATKTSSGLIVAALEHGCALVDGLLRQGCPHLTLTACKYHSNITR